jgi:DNA-binding IclR family transcriptional regulator
MLLCQNIFIDMVHTLIIDLYLPDITMEKNYSVPNLERSLEIIEFLSREKREFTITELARKIDFPRNSVFRIVKTLQQKGYIVSLSGKTYRLSSKLLSIGYAAVSEKNLLEDAAQPMRDLRDEVNETVFLGIILGSRGVVLEEILSHNVLKVKVDIGTLFPVYTGAPGKAILAYMNDTLRDNILDQQTWERFTENTIRKDIGDTIEATKDCNLEFAYRDIYTTNGDRKRLTEWVQLVRKMIGE